MDEFNRRADLYSRVRESKINTTPYSLGNGFTLSYQRLQAEPTNLRAVVKDSTGAIVTRGPVVEEARIAHTKFVAVSEWMKTQQAFDTTRPELESYSSLDDDEEEPEDDW
jgi:hypothetical protein